MAIVTFNDLLRYILVVYDVLAKILCIHEAGNGSRAYQVAEEASELTAFGGFGCAFFYLSLLYSG
jgi:hypothetical protein